MQIYDFQPFVGLALTVLGMLSIFDSARPDFLCNQHNGRSNKKVAIKLTAL